MYWDAIKVEVVSERCIYVELRNGKSGVFDASPYWDKGVLKELQNPQYFKQVMISHGCVSWPHGQDIAPETLLENLQPTSAPSDDWSATTTEPMRSPT